MLISTITNMGFFKLGRKKTADVELKEKEAAPAAGFMPATPQWPGSLASNPGSTADLTRGGIEGGSGFQDVKCDVMAQWLHSKQEEKIWTSGEIGEGVLVKKAKGSYSYSPAELAHDGSGLYEAVSQLNVRVCQHLNCSPTKYSSRTVCYDCQHPRPASIHERTTR